MVILKAPKKVREVKTTRILPELTWSLPELTWSLPGLAWSLFLWKEHQDKVTYAKVT